MFGNKDIRLFSTAFLVAVISILFSAPVRAIAADRPEIFVQLGHRSVITALAISPDGRYVASADDNLADRNIKIWEMSSGREYRTVIVKTAEQIRWLRFSADVKQLFVIAVRKIDVFDIGSGAHLKTIDIGHIRNINDIFSVDIDRLLSDLGLPAARHNSLGMLRPASQTLTSRDLIYSLTRKEQGKYDFTFAVQRASDRRLVRQIELDSLSHFVLTDEVVMITPDYRYLVAADKTNFQSTIKIWDIRTGWIVRELGGIKPARSIWLAFSLDHRYLLNFSGLNVTPENQSGAAISEPELNRSMEDRKVWDIESGRLLYSYRKGETPAEAYHSFFKENFINKKSQKINVRWGIQGSYDKKYAALANWSDLVLRLVEQNTNREIAQFISFTDGEWIVITPEGYFNASAGGAKHLNVRVGSRVFAVDQFYEKFFNPVYVATVLSGKKIEATSDIRKGFALPPEVKFVSPKPDATVNEESLTITVSAKDAGGGIDEIRLYHNGKAIGEDKRAVKIVPRGDEAIREYTVSLVDGLNSFRAVGFSRDRTESNPAELAVRLAAPSKNVSLYVFTVGINNYRNPALNLNYAEPDARGLADFFKAQGRRLFKKIEVIETYNEEATKLGITLKLKKLADTKPQDAVLIYLAGHGESIGEKWYFIPHELTYPERGDDVKAKGLSSDELAGYVRDIKAQKILMLIDACKAGAVLVAFRGFEDRKALSQLSRSTGVHVIAASTKDQYAAEVKVLGHGVFTYTLLEGLKGKAAGGSEAVTVRRLMSYIEELLPDLTKKYKQEAQYPVVDSKGMDFPLAIVK